MNLIAGGFSHVAGVLRLDAFPGSPLMHGAAFAIVGAAFTAGLRSASACIVLLLAAARADTIATSSVLCAALGALLASAWGALLAIDSGTPAARRAGLGVIAVHGLAALTGMALALALGPALNTPPGFLADPARTLALVLSVAPLAPVLVLRRFDHTLVDLIERRVGRDRPRTLARAVHDHRQPARLPPLAFEALALEVRRLHAVAGRLAAAVLSREPLTARRETTDRSLLRLLAQHIEEGGASLRARTSTPSPRRPCRP